MLFEASDKGIIPPKPSPRLKPPVIAVAVIGKLFCASHALKASVLQLHNG